MKLFFVLSVTLVVLSSELHAQSNADLNNRLLEEYNKKQSLSEKFNWRPNKITPPKFNIPDMPPPINRPKQEKQTPSVLQLPLKGKYIGPNGRGAEIYAMQPDNMPCLVPGKTFNSNMPVVEDEKQGRNIPFRLDKPKQSPESKD